MALYPRSDSQPQLHFSTEHNRSTIWNVRPLLLQLPLLAPLIHSLLALFQAPLDRLLRTATSNGQLRYSYQPPPKATHSLQNETRKTLSSLIHYSPSPIVNPATTRVGSMSKAGEHDNPPDPMSGMGTSGSAACALGSQVGGHSGILSCDDGSLIIKPCSHHERQFYDDLAASPATSVLVEGTQDASALSPFEALKPWVPRFYGALIPEDRAGQVGDKADTVTGKVTKSLVLENIAHPFVHANVLDVKLGTTLHEVGAPEDKQKRMEETARKTTSHKTGVRLTGFRVYDANNKRYELAPKSYGKSIKASELPAGIAKFFPATGEEGAGPGVCKDLLVPVVKGVLEDIQEVRKAVEQTEMRMVGGSLLIVWEGDEPALKEVFDKKMPTYAGATSGVSSELGGSRRVGPRHVVRLIDFAHTRAVPGFGPDDGVLKGIETLLSLLRGRLAELEA